MYFQASAAAENKKVENEESERMSKRSSAKRDPQRRKNADSAPPSLLRPIANFFMPKTNSTTGTRGSGNAAATSLPALAAHDIALDYIETRKATALDTSQRTTPTGTPTGGIERTTPTGTPTGGIERTTPTGTPTGGIERDKGSATLLPDISSFLPTFPFICGSFASHVCSSMHTP